VVGTGTSTGPGEGGGGDTRVPPRDASLDFGGINFFKGICTFYYTYKKSLKRSGLEKNMLNGFKRIVLNRV
jgi:hypothetical protein